METTDNINSIVKELFSRNSIEKHPLFEHLANDRLSARQVHETGLHIYHVVLHFPRFLSAILTNLPDYKVRMPLVENLFEEHGRLNEQYVHSQTYKQFLLGIGLTENTIRQSEASIPVIAYNRAITDLCLHHPFIEGLAALGVIEEIVARVSPVIGAYAQNKFSGNSESLFHFTSHETLDVSHERELYELVALHYNPETEKQARKGFELGMYYHKRLYTDILEYVLLSG
jgi:pyrroloquinoline-quinone synthase